MRPLPPRPIDMLAFRNKVQQALENVGFELSGGGVNTLEPEADLQMSLGNDDFSISLKWRGQSGKPPKELSIADLRRIFSGDKITDMSDTRSARLSAVEFLISRFEPLHCDSDAVAECVRCNALALARWMLKDLRKEVERVS